MALLISSTCLLGIIGASYLNFQFKVRRLFSTIMLLSLIVIALSLAWFTSPNRGLVLAMTILFGCQVITFTLLYVVILTTVESQIERYQRRLGERLESTLHERRGKAQAKGQTSDNHTLKVDNSKQ